MKSTKNGYSIQVLSSESNEIREVIEDRMRSAIIEMIYDFFEEELSALCGKYSSKNKLDI